MPYTLTVQLPTNATPIDVSYETESESVSGALHEAAGRAALLMTDAPLDTVECEAKPLETDAPPMSEICALLKLTGTQGYVPFILQTDRGSTYIGAVRVNHPAAG